MSKVWSIATVAACAFVYGAVLGGTLALGNEGQSTPSEGQKTDAREDARLPERVDLIKYVDEALKEPLPAKTMTNDDAELAWGRSYWMMAWLAIDEANGTTRYTDRARKLGNFFKHRLRHDKKEDLYDWAYWPELEGPGRGSEDTPHAYINVKTAALLHDQGLVFDKADMRRFCNTFTERVLPPSLRVAGYINGEGKPGESPHLAVAYGRLAFYDTKVRDRLHEYVGKILMPKKVRGGWACLGVAYLIHALPDEKPTKAPQ